jgi:hypothetical protein
MTMNLKLGKLVYSAYIKGNRFIGYFENAEFAMRWMNENYPAEDKHVGPCWILEEDKPSSPSPTK